jgi:HD-like signal output (HDOD) protein
MACPLDTDTVAELRQMTGLKIRPLLVSVDAVRGVLDRCYPASSVYDGPDGTLPAPSQIAPPPSRGPLPGVSSALAMENILSLVRSVQSLPALPEVVRRLREMIAKPDTTTKEVANEIAKDPALTAKVLSLANSSAYYLVQPVDSVPLATALLGLREIYHVVLSAVVMDQFSGSRHFDYAGFWRQARFCATAARILAKARGQKSADGVFSAGLLHDLGRLVLAELVPERYGQVGTHLPDEELLARESELFGIAHPEVGYVLASEWGLPEEIAAPVRFHHQPAYAREHRELVALVTLATGIFRLREGQSSDTASLLAGEHPEALELLQLTEQQLDVVVSVLKELSADDLA